MTATLKMDVSGKKGVVVSNHTGSQTYKTVNEAVEQTAATQFHQFGEDAVILKVTVYENYAKRQELLDYMRANPVTTTMIHREGQFAADVQTRFIIQY
jgi:hypothetical protein